MVIGRVEPGSPLLSMTEKQLEALYRRNNKRYFDDKLPARVPVHYTDMARAECCGLTTLFQDQGLSLPVIYLDSYFKNHEVILKQTLLHEMVHVKLQPTLPATSDSHGIEFQEEMVRLAFRGAFTDLW